MTALPFVHLNDLDAHILILLGRFGWFVLLTGKLQVSLLVGCNIEVVNTKRRAAIILKDLLEIFA